MTVLPNVRTDAMPGLRIYSSNRLEKLSAVLAGSLSSPLSDPLAPEVLVVQSPGMARWLSLEIARHCGICANTRFYYPNEFVDDVVGAAIDDPVATSAFGPAVMTWRIMQQVPEMAAARGFEAVNAYLQDDPSGVKTYQLAVRLADVFDQYVLFRPKMVLDWETGKGAHWQASLWRRLVSTAAGKHRAALLKAFQQRCVERTIAADRLPPRVSVFGVTALPAFHLEVIRHLASMVPVDLYLLNPCREYWGDILSDREIGRTVRRAAEKESGGEWMHMDQGNRLLAVLGTTGRDFLEMVHDGDGEHDALFEDPPGTSLLAALQTDILNLEGPAYGSERPKRRIATADRSVMIHSCHSPMREVEVLKDQILSWLDEDPGLCPGDILVMAPDIDIYAPYIQAVFDNPEEEKQRLPFTIADRSMAAESTIVASLLKILDLHGSRFTVSQVLAIMESEPLQRRFGFNGEDLDTISNWIGETAIRWGFDEGHRAAVGLPESAENTWLAGLNRLLLGYAMAGKGHRLFAGMLPCDDIEGSSALVAGRFADLIRRLKYAVDRFGGHYTLTEWSTILTGLLDECFAADEGTETDWQNVRSHLLQLTTLQEQSGFNTAVSVEVIKNHLKRVFQKNGFGYGFFTGGITFCALVPMRSIPSKIICLLGMDNDAFPRDQQRLGFDLIAAAPRPGDRSRRNDDQYLFLESIVSARNRLHISYVGQGIQDNSAIPPSVLVSMLSDYIEMGFEAPGGDIVDQIFVYHRLQPFSPDYFAVLPDHSESRLFSYSRTDCEGARALMSENDPPRPFFEGDLPLPGDGHRAITAGDLSTFLAHPAKYLVHRHLGIRLGVNRIELEDTEPFELNGLDRYQMAQQFVEYRLDRRDVDALRPVWQARGCLPHGRVGTALTDRIDQATAEFAAKIRERTSGNPLPPIDVDEAIAGFTLSGTLEGITADYLLRFRYARIRQKDLLAAWVHHLLLNCVRNADYPRTTLLAGLKGKSLKEMAWRIWRFAPVQQPQDELRILLDAYWQGLQRPLPFFPETSAVFAAAAEGDVETAVRRAESKWQGSSYAPGEGDDVYYRRCFGGIDVFEDAFFDLARAVYKPLRAHVTEEG